MRYPFFFVVRLRGSATVSQTELIGFGCHRLLVVLLATSAASVAQSTERISSDALGVQANGDSGEGAVSADGRYVVFVSRASNLVPGVTGNPDVFLRDRETGVIELVSVGLLGADATGASPTISGDGRIVVFTSSSPDLVSGDTNQAVDIFAYDRQTAVMERVSVDSTGAQGDASSQSPALSADGRFVAFVSEASNLVAGDTNGVSDVFVHDRQTGVTERVNLDPTGSQVLKGGSTPALSSDGRYVAFWSDAPRIVDGDTNGQPDVFVRDRSSGVTQRVSLGSTGNQGNGPSWYPSISADGRFVAFYSQSDNLVDGDTNLAVDVFVHDRLLATTERVSVDSAGAQGEGDSFIGQRALSSDGRHVAFHSRASNLVSDDTNGLEDVFVHDREDGSTTLVSKSTFGATGNELSSQEGISADGSVVVFFSDATDLVAGPDSGWTDVYVRDRCSPATSMAFLGDGVNLDAVAPMDATLGSNWSAPVALGHPHGTGGLLVLRVRTGPFNGPTQTSPVGGRPMEVLIAGPLLASVSGTHDGVNGDISPQAIPDGFSFVGLQWAAQYTVIGGGHADLSTAVTGVVGCP